MTSSPSKLHISLDVSDVDRSSKFYEAFFDAPVHKRRPGYANFDLAAPPLKLALNERTPTRGAGPLNHMGVVLETREAVQAVRERLEAGGLVSFDEGDTVCCYARQDKVWVQDPDGNKWEVYVLLDDMLDVEAKECKPGGECCTDENCCSESSEKEVCCA